MKPTELTDIANSLFSYTDVEDGTDEETGEPKFKKELSVSRCKITLSPSHSSQFNELVRKLGEVELSEDAKAALPKDKPTVRRISNRGGIEVKAADLIAVLAAANKAGVELDDAG